MVIKTKYTPYFLLEATRLVHIPKKWYMYQYLFHLQKPKGWLVLCQLFGFCARLCSDRRYREARTEYTIWIFLRTPKSWEVKIFLVVQKWFHCVQIRFKIQRNTPLSSTLIVRPVRMKHWTRSIFRFYYYENPFLVDDHDFQQTPTPSIDQYGRAMEYFTVILKFHGSRIRARGTPKSS